MNRKRAGIYIDTPEFRGTIGNYTGSKLVNTNSEEETQEESEYNLMILEDTPVAFWPLDDAPGTLSARNLIDSNLTADVTPSNTSDVSFDGEWLNYAVDSSNTCLSVATNTLLSRTVGTRTSIEFWYEGNNLNHTVFIDTTQYISGAYEGALTIRLDNFRLGAGAWFGGATNLLKAEDAKGSSMSRHHVVVTLNDEDENSSILRIYLDAELVYESTRHGANLARNASVTECPIYIGAIPEAGASDHNPSKISKVAIYGYELAPSVIQLHYDKYKVEPEITPITSGENVTLSGTAETMQFFEIDVGGGVGSLDIVTTGGTGDVDIYVNFETSGSPTYYYSSGVPDIMWYLLNSENVGNEETINYGNPPEGKYYITAYFYEDSADITLTATAAAMRK